eukprot:SAG31_NODE_4103_length_3579_cov_2.836494_4_plen_260_part_00
MALFFADVVSDCGAVSCIQNSHHYTNTTEDTCAVALHGGCDLDCGGLLAQCASAVRNHTRGLDVGDVDRALVRIFSQRIATGEFEPDGAESVSYRKIGLEHFNSSAAQQLALQTARESVVLMKNVARTLPISLPSLSVGVHTNTEDNQQLKILAAGPGLKNDMLGDYHGTPPVHITFEAGLRNFELRAGFNLTVLDGCDINSADESRIPAVVSAAKDADVVFLFLGLDGSIENEGQDRPIGDSIKNTTALNSNVSCLSV